MICFVCLLQMFISPKNNETVTIICVEIVLSILQITFSTCFICMVIFDYDRLFRLTQHYRLSTERKTCKSVNSGNKHAEYETTNQGRKTRKIKRTKILYLWKFCIKIILFHNLLVVSTCSDGPVKKICSTILLRIFIFRVRWNY